MAVNIILALAGFAFLYYGGEFLVKSAVIISRKIGMSTLAIGLTVVAFGTSLPELAVSLNAAVAGANDISVGNVVGSNIANIGLILGLSAMFRPMHVQANIIRYYTPGMLLIISLVCLFLINRRISRPEGLVLFAGLIIYIWFTIWEARRTPENIHADFEKYTTLTARQLWQQVFLMLLGFVLLIGGGRILVNAAVEIAEHFQVSQAVIGLTVVAVGTSLPELATSLIAALRGFGDMAIGNIIGSNIFNVLGILGITATLYPLEANAITLGDYGTMSLLSLVMALFLFARRRLARLEGAILLAIYACYLVWLVP